MLCGNNVAAKRKESRAGDSAFPGFCGTLFWISAGAAGLEAVLFEFVFFNINYSNQKNT